MPTIAQALGLREQPGEPALETLNEYLRDKELLLVLDNFEQVLAAAPAIAELLGRAPRPRRSWSRAGPLRPPGEHEYRVPPLGAAGPAATCPAAEEVADYEAVRAVRRARAGAAARLRLTDENAPAVAEICVRLDGLPLAIELAAARVRMLPPQALLRRLDQRLPLLTGGARDLPARSRRCAARSPGATTCCWRAEQALFARLAVFVGGCRLEAAEAVCDPDGTLGDGLLDGLASLVDKSLLRQARGLRRRAALLDARDDPRVRARAARVGRRARGWGERHAAWTAG